MVTPDDVLKFWFGEPPADPNELMVKIRRWFRGGPEMDAEVQAKFGGAVTAALAGELDAWADSARSRLALVLLLDQFTRNVFRGDPKTYAGDAKAQALALEAFDSKVAGELELVQRIFLSMPLLHSEHPALQERLRALTAEFVAQAPPLYARMAAMNAEQSAKYQEIIARFGSFPHRNANLGRTSTAEEIEFLRDWEQKQAPSGAP